MHSFFCFPTCHCFLSSSKVFLTAVTFVQVLSHTDFPSPKLYIKECGIKGKTSFFPFTDKRKLLCFQDSQKANLTCCQNATTTKKSLFLVFLFSMCGLKRSFGGTIYVKSRFPEQTKKPFQFNQVWKNSLHYLTV